SLLLVPSLLRVHVRILFFFNDTAPTEIYTLSLHDALPIYLAAVDVHFDDAIVDTDAGQRGIEAAVLDQRALHDPVELASIRRDRSEEHTSELQSLTNLVCRLLLEKKKIKSTLMEGMLCYQPNSVNPELRWNELSRYRWLDEYCCINGVPDARLLPTQ